MSQRMKKLVAATTLLASLAGGGAVIAANASDTIAATADAGLPGPIGDLKR